MKKLASGFIYVSLCISYAHISRKIVFRIRISMVNQKPDIDVAMGPLTRNKFKKLLDECDIKLLTNLTME